MSDSSSSSTSDWANLPSDLLRMIAGTLALSDRLCFGFVCIPWYSVTKIPSPLFLIPEYYFDFSTFFSVQDHSHHKLHITEPSNHATFISTSPYGWVLPLHLLRGKQEASLVNPVSGRCIRLPDINFYDHIRNAKLVPCGNSPSRLYVMLTTSTNLVVVCPVRSRGISESEVMEWKMIGSCENVGDYIFHKGRFYVVERVGESKCLVIDEESCEVVEVLSWVSKESEKARYSFIPKRFLVESSAGEDLFLVTSHSVEEKEWFEVFRLDEREEEGRKWSRARDIGKDVIFLDGHRGMAL